MRRITGYLGLGRIYAKCGKCGENIGFDVEHANQCGTALPMATGAGQMGGSGANTGCAQVLVARLFAFVGLAKLEQRDIGGAAIAITGDGGQQPRQETGTHRRHFDRDRIGEVEFGRATAEVPGFALRNEAPGHSFDEAARREQTAGATRALLLIRQNGAGDAVGAR